MFVEIFDVEHGACALITTSNGKRIMVDAGHNASTGWMPGTMLAGRGLRKLDLLAVTNYGEDHVSGYRNLRDNVGIAALARNGTVSAQAIQYLKTEDGMGSGIAALVSSIDHYFTGPAPVFDFGDTSMTFYSNNYGALGGFNDENNLSLVVFVKCGAHKIIFPGDMEKEGWRQLLQDPAFREEFASVTFFVASHHGRENGYCKEVMDLCPNIIAIIISDKNKGYQSQETCNTYRLHARGFDYFGKERRVLTTRSDGYIVIEFSATNVLAAVHLGLAA